MSNEEMSSMVLIVDDSAVNLQILGKMLRNNNFNVVAAQGGFEALDFVQKKQPDLILLDIMMPGMDGFEVCQTLKESSRTRNIPVIFITALTEVKDKLKAFELGGVDYISKPFIEEEVLARVNVHIKLKKTIEKYEALSVKDELTGVFNRRFAYEILYKKMELAKREKENFVICYIDIDNLKQVNDTFGHNEGDLLINVIIKSFQEFLRSSDYLFRMGGDEFLIIFPKVTIEVSQNIINRVEVHLKDQNIQGSPIEFSFGLIEYHYEDGVKSDDLINQADAKMYAKKKKKKKDSLG